MPSGSRRASPDEVEREASRHALNNLGDEIWVGDPLYEERHEEWAVPLHSRALPEDVEIGRIILNAQGKIVHAPSRRDLRRAIEQHQRGAGVSPRMGLKPRWSKTLAVMTATVCVGLLVAVRLGIVREHKEHGDDARRGGHDDHVRPPSADDYSWISSRPVNLKDLEGRDSKTLRRTLSYPFARRGYEFRNQDLREFYGRQSWYRSLPKRRDVNENELTSLERNNIATIREWIRMHSDQRKAGVK